MTRFDRRELLSRALVAGAGATLFQHFAPSEFGPDAAQAAALAPGEYDPGFVAGRILGVSGDGRLTVLDPDHQLRTLQLLGATEVWKRGEVNVAELETGDCLYARGTPNPDGSIALESVWANISNVRGAVVDKPGGLVRVQLERNGNVASVQIPPALSDQVAKVTPGDWVMIIGYGDNPVTGRAFTASTIYTQAEVVAKGTDGSTAAPVPIPDTGNCQYAYDGIASWFCCGGVNGCGSGTNGNPDCSSSGQGACSGCRADYQQTAWPYLLKDNGQIDGVYCGNCCASFVLADCGDSVLYTSYCLNKSLQIPIRDHGPQIHCPSPVPTCKSFTHVKFDLTPCAFTGLGGNLGSGLMDVHAVINEPC